MKFNLFLLFLTTLCAVAYSDIFQIVQNSAASKQWIVSKDGSITLSEFGTWWRNIAQGSFYEIVVNDGQPNAGHAVTYNGPGQHLMIKPRNFPPVSEQLWKFIPDDLGKPLAIRSVADSTQCAIADAKGSFVQTSPDPKQLPLWKINKPVPRRVVPNS
ncbi:hypothetical protein C1646_671224 [Rhizophagus diaphanus]|nr:hypothetical protein C1646_671224 [Rhizophagus diaphanus] [Rhizophagus sp. MUCL 43196]